MANIWKAALCALLLIAFVFAVMWPFPSGDGDSPRESSGTAATGELSTVKGVRIPLGTSAEEYPDVVNDPACRPIKPGAVVGDPSGRYSCGSDNPFEAGGYRHLNTLDRECYSRGRPCVYAMTVSKDASVAFKRRFSADPCGIVRHRQVQAWRKVMRHTPPRHRPDHRWVPTKCIATGDLAFFNGLVPGGKQPDPKPYDPSSATNLSNPNDW